MKNSRAKRAIENLVKKPNLSHKEILFILSNELFENGVLWNIECFNQWKRGAFSRRRFTDPISLENVELRNVNLSNVDFRYVTIKNSKFYGCDFSNASFWGSTFIDVRFWGAKVDNANFRGTKFEDCNLEELNSQSHLCLLESKFINCRLSFKNIERIVIDFSGSMLKDCLITVPTVSQEGSYDSINPFGLDENKIVSQNRISELILDYCSLERVRIANLHICSFSGKYLISNNSDFINSIVDKFKSLRGFVISEFRVGDSFFDDFLNSATIEDEKEIKLIRDNYKRIGCGSGARKFYIFSKEIEIRTCKKALSPFRSQNWAIMIRYFLLRFFKEISEFGESPSKILVFSMDIVVYSAIVNYLFGLTKTNTILGNLYLSTITFATVGYGDYYPVCPLGKLILGMVGFWGVFLMAFFVVSLTKIIIEE